MPALPFEKLRQIEQILDEVKTEDLVLVFSQSNGDQYLFVYNSQQFPTMTNPLWTAQALSKIGSVDYASFDGLIVGLTDIDLILPDVPTHGINFYPLERLLRDKGQEKQELQTLYRLAQTLLEQPQAQSTQRPPRTCAKIIQLALPFLLAGRPLENLVAVLPATDLAEFLDLRQLGYRLIYTHDLDSFAQSSLDLKSQWLVALEEISLFYPEVDSQSQQFIDLRPILRHLSQEEALKQTCLELAHYCWCRWQSLDSSGEQFRCTAYLLAAEAWLLNEDMTDLVALFPHQDFENFRKMGRALRIYRVPILPDHPLSSIPGPRYSLGDLADGKIAEPDYATSPLSFPILKLALQNISTQKVIDLAPIFWKLGRDAELARAFWLLSRDLLQGPGPRRLRDNAQPEAITDLTVRAALLYSLRDPWQWREGRRDLFLRQCYAHVADCLLNQENWLEKSPLAHYYRTLREWYDCFISDNPTLSLSRMIKAGQNFYENCQSQSNWPAECHVVERLIKIGESFLTDRRVSARHGAVVEGLGQLVSMAQYLRRVVDSESKLSVPSELFEAQLDAYHDLHARWREVEEMIRDSGKSPENLDELLATYKRWQRVVYAPAHELNLLSRAYAKDIERINLHKQAIETGPTTPIIEITVRNPWVTRGVAEELTIDVENAGGVVAYQFRLELIRTKEFELLSPSAALSLDTLAPGQRARLECEIRATEQALPLNFSYSYHDQLDQSQPNPKTTWVEVRPPRRRDLEPTGNLFEVGRPVFGADYFFGRHKELKEILTSLAKGSTQATLLHGPRRMGKTSIMRQVKLILTEHQELRRLDLSPDLETQLRRIYPIFASLQALSQKSPNYVALFLQDLIKDICHVLEIEWDEQQIARAFERSLPTRAFSRQVDRIFAQRPQARLLVLLDEWDEVYHMEAGELGKNLRYLLQFEQRISWIFSSTWLLVKESGQFSSPFFHQLYRVKVKEMKWKTASELVESLSQKVGVEWYGEAIVALLEQTGRRPYLIQLVCFRIINHLIDQHTNVVDGDIVEVVINQVIKEASETNQFFSFLWNNDSQADNDEQAEDQVRWMGRLILWALDSRYPTPLTRAEIRAAIAEEFQHYGLTSPERRFLDREFEDQLKKLQEIFDAITVEDNRYSFSIPLLRRRWHQIIAQQEDFIIQAHAGLIQDLQQ